MSTPSALQPNYCTVDQVLAYLGLTNGGQPDQANIDLIGTFISGQCRFIERYTGHVFGMEGTSGAPISRTFYVSTAIVALRPYLVSLNSVSLDDTVMDTSSYYLDTQSAGPAGMVPPYTTLVLHNYLYSSWFERGFDSPHSQRAFSPYIGQQRKVTVTGVWGWPFVPDDIVDAAIVLVARRFRGKDAGYSDAIGTTQDGQAIYSKAMPSDIKMNLDLYKQSSSARV